MPRIIEKYVFEEEREYPFDVSLWCECYFNTCPTEHVSLPDTTCPDLGDASDCPHDELDDTTPAYLSHHAGLLSVVLPQSENEWRPASESTYQLALELDADRLKHHNQD